MREQSGFVYILTNINNRVLYVGVTANIQKRIFEHKEKLIDGFSKKYNLTKLVYYESLGTIVDAILREKQIKGWLRKKKLDLINAMNPHWDDLYQRLF